MFYCLLNNVSSDGLCLHLFPFSLKDKGKPRWDSKTNITTWSQMPKEFLEKFFFIGKLTVLGYAITTLS